jgi:Flp pilus assembly protein TadB
MTAIVLAGAVCGIGVFLLVYALQRPQTRGAGAPAALARMDLERHKIRESALAARNRAREASAPGSSAETGLVARLEPVGRAVRRELDAIGIRLPARVRSDLSLIGRSIETHLALSLLGAAVGFVLSVLLAGVLGTLLPGLPVLSKLILFGLGILVGAALQSVQTAARATVRRRDFRHVVGSFLDLVAMNLSGGRGVPEALIAASSVSDGWAMVRIRDCLEIARLQGVTPWVALGELGEQTGVAELRDLSAALELVADDGAKVRESLATRAASLRRQELADVEGRAQARSQSMLVAQLLLAIGFLIFLIYPAVIRVLGT